MRIHEYIIRRVLMGIPTFFILISLMFVVVRLLPGDPVQIIIAQGGDPALEDELRHELGLDKPLWSQYIDFTVNIFRGDLGKSVWSRRSVLAEILTRLPTTLELTMAAMLISGSLGIMGGVVAATNKGKIIDHILRSISTTMNSLPIFLVGIIFQLVLGVYLGLLPIAGRTSPSVYITRITGFNVLDSIITVNLTGLLNSLQCLLLPSVTLAFALLPAFIRVTRANMIEVLSSNYITTAIAKGLPKKVIRYKHALRNATLPIATLGTMYLTLLIGAGAAITESVFALPGLGRLLVSSAASRDFPMITGCLVFLVILVLVASIAIDIIYCFLDPRIRLEKDSG